MYNRHVLLFFVLIEGVVGKYDEKQNKKDYAKNERNPESIIKINLIQYGGYFTTYLVLVPIMKSFKKVGLSFAVK